MNVDDLGNRLNPGQLEITETDLVLYQRKKAPVKWPLRSLRRYGFDAELFSFESGRRCPTGPGIYAFRCQRAEQLFNLLQTHIQVRNNIGEDAISRDMPVASNPGPAVPTRLNISNEGNYLDPAPARRGSRNNVPGSIRFISQNGGGPTRLSSVGSSSNGPISPQGTASPSPPPIPLPVPMQLPQTPVNSVPNTYYVNEDLFATSQERTIRDTCESGKKSIQTTCPISLNDSNQVSSESTEIEPNLSKVQLATVAEVKLFNVVSERPQTLPAASYINIDLSNGPLSPAYCLNNDMGYSHVEHSADMQPGHLYMNVIPGTENVIKPNTELTSATSRPKSSLPNYVSPLSQEWSIDETRHCYANLEPSEREVARSHIPKRLSGSDRMHSFSLSSSQSQNSISNTASHARQVNYIVLDLDQGKSDSSCVNGSSNHNPTTPSCSATSASNTLPPESPHKVSEGYATIDFDKTVALSHSVNPSMDNDSEGSRKTRHNSTITDLIPPPTRHSSSE